MPELADLLAVFDLEPTGAGTFTGSSIEFGGGSVVFGGQLLAQSMLAGATADPSKEVKSIHTIFARGASTGRPVGVRRGRDAVGPLVRQCHGHRPAG